MLDGSWENELSSAVAAVAIRAVAEVVPEATVVVNPSLMNHIVRKGAHVVAYMVLGSHCESVAFCDNMYIASDNREGVSI